MSRRGFASAVIAAAITISLYYGVWLVLFR
jgi:hypothetical protein